LQAERDPVPPGRLVGPQPVIPEIVRLYRAEVEQFWFACYRTESLFPPSSDGRSCCGTLQDRVRYRPQSSSASRFTAGATGFFILSQSGERPER